MIDWTIVRWIFAISTTVLLLVIVYKRWVAWFAPQSPPENQAWLMDMRLAYHPLRLEADLQIPEATELVTEVVSSSNEVVLMWDEESYESGNFTLQRALEGLAPGDYGFRIATRSQSTTRGFTVKS